MPKKLSANQRDVLAVLAEGVAVYQSMEPGSIYSWYIHGRPRPVTQAVNSLQDAGLVDVDASNPRRPLAVITDAGRAALASGLRPLSAEARTAEHWHSALAAIRAAIETGDMSEDTRTRLTALTDLAGLGLPC